MKAIVFGYNFNTTETKMYHFDGVGAIQNAHDHMEELEEEQTSFAWSMLGDDDAWDDHLDNLPDDFEPPDVFNYAF